MNHKPVEGFSKLSKQGKIDWLINEYLEGKQEYQDILHQYWNENPELQKLHEEFSENTISNFTVYIKFKKNTVPYLNSNFYYYASKNAWESENYTEKNWPLNFLYMHQASSSHTQKDSQIHVFLPVHVPFPLLRSYVPVPL